MHLNKKYEIMSQIQYTTINYILQHFFINKKVRLPKQTHKKRKLR